MFSLKRELICSASSARRAIFTESSPAMLFYKTIYYLPCQICLHSGNQSFLLRYFSLSLMLMIHADARSVTNGGLMRFQFGALWLHFKSVIFRSQDCLTGTAIYASIGTAFRYKISTSKLSSCAILHEKISPAFFLLERFLSKHSMVVLGPVYPRKSLESRQNLYH